MYDPQRKRDTLAEFRIHCDLMTDEFTSEFCNLDPKRQSQVLRQLNGRIKRVDMTQLLWLRRSCAMPCVDMIYILIAILVGWTNKDNESTVGTAPLIASDFMYNTLTDRMSQESFYDKVIMTQLKQKTYQLVVDTYDAISACKIKSRVFGTHKVLFATLFPKHAVEHIDELRFLGFMISSLHSRGNSDEGFCRVLVFVRNPDAEETLAYGYSPEVSGNFPDIWPLVFSSIAHDDTTFVFDVFRPTCLDIRSDDVESAKNRIADRLRIALEAKQVSYFASNDVHSDEEASFVGSDEGTEESQ
ncbi:hypothetical protein, conserved [Babesia bigemina]|uniref:Uncharacterized protein n=1 Tax=Babesia bigemina TaxID=5866 RepID=A0A061D1V4_BABBI|nr:hypothetical protein, conserved [Babesia bigemina]CDR94618.1 hypothetical protein, conserved [Babesia bigemina]|eukprot:XP_012766804.1 hypothetical protein, conserved [Babesia bigemina]